MEQKLSPPPADHTLSRTLGFGFLASGALLLWLLLSPVASANWWASFILLPVVALLGLVPLVRPHSRLTANFFQALAFIIATVAGIFLLGLNWSIYWPLMIIVPGLSVFFMGLRAGAGTPLGRALAGSTRWLGLTMLLLGTTFQLYAFGLLTLPVAGFPFNWWSLFIAFFALGVGANARKLQRETGRSPATLSFYTVSGWLLLTAVFEGIGYNWQHWQAIVGLIFITLGAAQLLVRR